MLALKCYNCLIKTVQRCSPCGVRIVIEKGVLELSFFVSFLLQIGQLTPFYDQSNLSLSAREARGWGAGDSMS